MEDWATQLAREFRSRDNPNTIGPIIGTIVSPPPDLNISILEGQVFITKCYVLDYVLNDYTRTISIPTTTAMGTGVTNAVNDGGDHATAHSHSVLLQSIALSLVQVVFNDTLKVGDQVLLIPTGDNQVYFLVGKVTLLEG
jgi:hypothetical protein|uniref:DUF2577 domain-containing protein n=1 Tax=Siphoviridae sp. ctVqj4 TaxID=2826359 RepID=A0A8S5NJR9_9CAUD|nr:MAG TPA: Protein of unknown function (DUF2577) [Siphoviridae sp. ctVqj4]